MDRRSDRVTATQPNQWRKSFNTRSSLWAGSGPSTVPRHSSHRCERGKGDPAGHRAARARRPHLCRAPRPGFGSPPSSAGCDAASCLGIVVDGAVLGVAAATGTGKSSLAAWMYLNGYTVFADDVLALRTGDPDQLSPAYPIIKLLQDTVRFLDLDAGGMQQLEPPGGKLGLDISSRFAMDPLPLRGIVILERAPGTESQRLLSGSDAVMGLVENSYGLSSLHAAGQLGDHLPAASLIANRVPIARVHVLSDRPIEEVAGVVLEAFDRIGSPR